MTATATLTADQLAAVAALPEDMRQTALDILTRTETARAAIAASDYRRTVTLRRANLEVIITVAPADCGTSWQVEGVGIERGRGGHNRVGDVQARYFTDLDGENGAKAYANGWAKNLQSKGYRIAR